MNYAGLIRIINKQLSEQRSIVARFGASDNIMLKEYTNRSKEKIEALELELKALRTCLILQAHPTLNLSVLQDYRDIPYQDFIEDWYGTNNELKQDEFELLLEMIPD